MDSSDEVMNIVGIKRYEYVRDISVKGIEELLMENGTDDLRRGVTCNATYINVNGIKKMLFTEFGWEISDVPNDEGKKRIALHTTLNKAALFDEHDNIDKVLDRFNDLKTMAENNKDTMVIKQRKKR